ncbi:MAG: DNA polymerase III subunit gamma/tau [Burkholderiales bacterium]|nr:DNA polymerase III subunit gamma/tau [Burkholderiales bacterium]
MSYQVLARKWRPRDFEAMVGQEHVVRALRHALAEGRLHHAYLFTGTRGVGKTTLARILAKCLNCERGVGPQPCGQCGACVEIDGGRFPDLLEVDAATNTGIDEMRALQESGAYVPVRGRYKVFVIDEVHMLSKPAFNSMLKTLEEPPAHLKFILATTDPQKIPVTVLSRCLQFNLRSLSRQAIAAHLGRVLDAERLPYEPEALPLLAQAAAGSMRDALSLLDQAIAHGGGRVAAADVRAMLGALDDEWLHRLLEAIAAGDGAGAMALADEMQARSLSFDTALRELAALLTRVSLLQLVPSAIEDDAPDRAALARLAARLDPATVQLYYQIALQGRQDLERAPDEHAGFLMTLLRMLAFRPEEEADAQPAAVPVARATQEKGAFDGDWPALARALPVTGAVRQLALNAELRAWNGSAFELVVPRSLAHLAGAAYRDKLRTALEQHLGGRIDLRVSVGETRGTSAAALEAGARAAQRTEALRAMENDSVVRELIETFDARLLEASVQPTGRSGGEA